jgi:hypothetical protein
MNKEELGESAKPVLIVGIISGITSFPVKESHLQLITSGDLRYDNTSLFRPLPFGKYQYLIGTICFNALPGGYAYTIAINLSRYPCKYLIL